MRNLMTVAALLALAVPGAAASGPPQASTLTGYGLTIAVTPGWYGVSTSEGLELADFRLPAKGDFESVEVARGRIHLVLWNYGPAVPYLDSNFPPARAPLSLSRHDLSDAGIESFPQDDVFALRNATVGGEMLQIVADLGPKPLRRGRDALAKLNGVLSTLRVLPARVIRPEGGRLASDGVAVRLPAGWRGTLRAPADRSAARLMLRAHRDDVHVVLLESAETAEGAAHADLPIRIGPKDILRRHPIAIARLVFSTAGRAFDLTVTAPTPPELAKANVLLASLTVTPRPWLFHTCDLTLRLPGTWTAAVNPRTDCYPVITLRGAGVEVTVTEVRPGERPAGSVIRRAGRVFQLRVAPHAGQRSARAVLATLTVAPRR